MILDQRILSKEKQQIKPLLIAEKILEKEILEMIELDEEEKNIYEQLEY